MCKRECEFTRKLNFRFSALSAPPPISLVFIAHEASIFLNFIPLSVVVWRFSDSDSSPFISVTGSGGQISTKHQKTSIKPFFATCRLPQYPEFAKNLRSFDGFDQMSGLWSMFWFKSFRNFFRKIAIFRNFDYWSEILSMSAGRPISQGVCPPLAHRTPTVPYMTWVTFLCLKPVLIYDFAPSPFCISINIRKIFHNFIKTYS